MSAPESRRLGRRHCSSSRPGGLPGGRADPGRQHLRGTRASLAGWRVAHTLRCPIGDPRRTRLPPIGRMPFLTRIIHQRSVNNPECTANDQCLMTNPTGDARHPVPAPAARTSAIGHWKLGFGHSRRIRGPCSRIMRVKHEPAARSSRQGHIHIAQPRTRCVSPSSSASPSLDGAFLTKQRQGRTTAA